MEIIKADGTSETFNSDKLRTSLKHSGAKDKDIDYIVSNSFLRNSNLVFFLLCNIDSCAKFT